MEERDLRTSLLIGEAGLSKLRKAKVAIIGLGGVGGSAFECLLRSGILHFTIVDFDVVEPSNLNRQVLYGLKDIGKAKSEVAKEWALALNPEADISAFAEKADNEWLRKGLLDSVDVVVDCVDDVKAKLELLTYARETGKAFVMSLGMAGRLDPTRVRIVTLDKTSNDPLARKIRAEVRKLNIPLSEVNVAFSDEVPFLKAPSLPSMMAVPSAAGLALASYVIKKIIGD